VSEKIQSENNEELSEELEKNEVQKSDIIEKSTSGSEEIQSESNEEINEELEKKEVQKSNKKEDVLKQDSPN
jgi:F0F1-type ATP synthase membrane subunit b/b'